MGLLDLLFPRNCLGCRQPGGYFCPKCAKTTKEASPIIQVNQPDSSLEGLVSLFDYDGIIKEAIHRLKYRYVTDLWGEFFGIIGKRMDKKEEELGWFFKFIKEKPLVVPVPLHWYKQNVRGFNQASLLGNSLAQKFKLPFSEKVLVRKKFTVSQTQLKGKEREKNVKNAFATPSTIILNTNPNILLVDDVWTTGSTMESAARVLRKAGAKKVWGLTIAR